jgi:hypothetical protein
VAELPLLQQSGALESRAADPASPVARRDAERAPRARPRQSVRWRPHSSRPRRRPGAVRVSTHARERADTELPSVGVPRRRRRLDPRRTSSSADERSPAAMSTSARSYSRYGAELRPSDVVGERDPEGQPAPRRYRPTTGAFRSRRAGPCRRPADLSASASARPCARAGRPASASTARGGHPRGPAGTLVERANLGGLGAHSIRNGGRPEPRATT